MADGKIIIDTKVDTSGAEKGISKLGCIAGKGLKIAAGAITGAGAILGSLGTYVLKVGSNFEEGMSKVQAISGASAEDMTKLSEKAKEMGIKTKFSATESAEALQYMAMAGWKTDQMMSGLPGIMNLAAASGEDLALTSDIVTDALTAFGMKAEESSHFADILASASSNSNTNVAMLGESFKYVAPVAGALGHSAKDTSFALGLMANSGIKASQSGTALRAALTNLAHPSKNMAKEIDKLGISLTTSNGKVKEGKVLYDELRQKFSGLTDAQKTQSAATIFGKEAMSGMLAVINASDEDYNKLYENLSNCDGAAEKMAETMNDNLKGQVTLLKSSLEGLGIELYESVDNPLKDIVKSSKDMIDGLTNAFKNGGFEGLVAELGNILATVISNIASATPQIIDSAVNLISSFINGIEDNLPKIIDSGGKIVESLIDGASNVLPQIANLAINITEILIKNLFGNKVANSFKEFAGEVKKCFEEIKNTAEKVVKSMVTVFGKLANVFLQIGSKLLPILTKAIQLLGNNLNTIIPLITAVYTGFKAYSILSVTTGFIKKMTTAWNVATTALAAHEAASRLTLVTINGGLPITTVLVGVLTGKITLATAAQAAWNAIMAANPIGLLVTAIAALTAGLVTYSLMQKDVYTGQERLNAANEALGTSYEKIANGIVDFHNGIQNASNILDGFNDSIIVSNEEQQNLSTRMDEVQGQITQIARTATEERRNLTQSEIQKLDELFNEMRKLTERELEIQEAYQQVVQDRAQVLADTHNGSLEEYQTYAQSLIKSAEDTKTAVIQKADEQCTEEIALINSKYEAMGTMGSEEYNTEIEAANNKYTSAVDAANKECGDTLSIIQEGYANRATEMQNYTQLHEELKQQEQDSDESYNSALEEEEERHKSAVCNTRWDHEVERKRHNDEMQKIEDNHANEIAAIHEQEAKDLDNNVAKQGAALLDMVAKTELHGGEVTDETRDMANAIIDEFDKLPPETQEAMTNVMKPMLEEMRKSEPGLFSKADDIAEGILTRLKKSFDVHSPSRKTRKIFKYVMEGAELGMDDETSNLYDQTDDISEGVLKRFNATKFDVSSLTSKMKAAVDFETAKTSANITNSSNYKIEMESVKNSQDNSVDGIPNGSVFILKNDIDGKNLGETVYNVVNNKLALASKRVR